MKLIEADGGSALLYFLVSKFFTSVSFVVKSIFKLFFPLSKKKKTPKKKKKKEKEKKRKKEKERKKRKKKQRKYATVWLITWIAQWSLLVAQWRQWLDPPSSNYKACTTHENRPLLFVDSQWGEGMFEAVTFLSFYLPKSFLRRCHREIVFLPDVLATLVDCPEIFFSRVCCLFERWKVVFLFVSWRSFPLDVRCLTFGIPVSL